MSLVYLISEDTDPNLCKIGVTRSKDINKRIKQLQTGNGNKLFVKGLFETENAFQLEKMLHFHFDKEREEGEWFLLSNEQIRSFPELCLEFQGIIDVLNNTDDIEL